MGVVVNDVEFEEVEVDPGSLSERTTNEGKVLVDSKSIGFGVVVYRETDDDSVLSIVGDLGPELGANRGHVRSTCFLVYLMCICNLLKENFQFTENDTS